MKPNLVEASEARHARDSESNVEHDEISRISDLSTFIFGDFDQPLPEHLSH